MKQSFISAFLLPLYPHWRASSYRLLPAFITESKYKTISLIING